MTNVIVFAIGLLGFFLPYFWGRHCFRQGFKLGAYRGSSMTLDKLAPLMQQSGISYERVKAALTTETSKAN